MSDKKAFIVSIPESEIHEGQLYELVFTRFGCRPEVVYKFFLDKSDAVHGTAYLKIEVKQ